MTVTQIVRAVCAPLLIVFGGAAVALTVFEAPLEAESLPGVWISPVGEFTQARLDISSAGTGTFVFVLYRSIEKDSVRTFTVLRSEVREYELSLTLAPRGVGDIVVLGGTAVQSELRLKIENDTEFDGPFSIRLVPEAIARSEVKEIEQIQVMLSEAAIGAEF